MGTGGFIYSLNVREMSPGKCGHGEQPSVFQDPLVRTGEQQGLKGSRCGSCWERGLEGFGW